MSSPVAILRELHRLTQHVANLQAEMDRGPRTLKAHEAKVAKLQEAVQVSHDAVKKLKIAIHSKEVSIKEKQQQIGKYEQQRNQVTSKKEYDALQSEIAHARDDIRKIEDEILNVMEEMEIRSSKLPELEKEVERGKKETAKVIDELQSRRTGLVDMLAAAHKQRQEVEANLPAEIKTQYDRLVAARGEDALAALKGRTCTACYTEITTQNYLDLAGGRFVLCKSCGRILYLTEQEEPQEAGRRD